VLPWREKGAARLERRTVKTELAVVATFEEDNATFSGVKHNITAVWRGRKMRHRCRLPRRAVHQWTARLDGACMSAKPAHGSTTRDEGEIPILAFGDHDWRRPRRRWFRFRPLCGQAILSKGASHRECLACKLERAHRTICVDEFDTGASRDEQLRWRCRWRRR